MAIRLTPAQITALLAKKPKKHIIGSELPANYYYTMNAGKLEYHAGKPRNPGSFQGKAGTSRRYIDDGNIVGYKVTP